MNNQTAQNEIVLASGSPRRAELLAQLGWVPKILSVDIDESVVVGEAAKAYCLRMAKEKSYHARNSIQMSLPVLTADTIVVLGDEILGKPKDRADAVSTLHKLSGGEHQVYTAVCVFHAGKSKTILSASTVKMAPISEAQIAAYVATGEPMDKAGAYGIQGYAAMWIENINGSYSSIMGLPLFETTALLDELGIMSPLIQLNQS